jgi:hypothetical protein
MSSSYAIRQRQLNDEQRLQIKGAVYGDVYIRPYGQCHPDFVSIPINRPDGPRVCVRKPEKQRDPPQPTEDERNIDGAGNMYTLKKNFVVDRTRGMPREKFEKMPNQDELVKNGYLRWEKRQNPLGVPNQLWYNNGYNVDGAYVKDRTWLDDTTTDTTVETSRRLGSGGRLYQVMGERKMTGSVRSGRVMPLASLGH